MSSYLNFYLVPKTELKEPLRFMSVSRSSDIYTAFKDFLNPIYGGFENKYTKLTVENMEYLIRRFTEELEETKLEYDTSYKITQGTMSVTSEIVKELTDKKIYILKQEKLLQELKFIRDFVEESTISWSDFEQVLINIT